MTDGYVYAVASGKGGVGKTTTAVNLGAAFVEADRSVVVVDVDLGMANLDDFLDVERPEATLHDVLAGDASIEAAITEAPGGFDVVLGSPEIEAFGRADPATMRELLPALREQYDLVLLDGGGGLSHDMTVPLGLADEVIIVTTPADAAITNAAKTTDLVERLGTDIAGLIVTRLGGAGRPTPEAVGDRLDRSVLGSVPEDGAIQMSADEGTPLMTIDRQSPAAQSYREIAYALVDEPLPRDWAEDDHAIDKAMGGGDVADADAEAVAEAEEPAEPTSGAEEPVEPTSGAEEPTEPSSDDEDGIADRLERMEEDAEETATMGADGNAETETGVTAETTDESAPKPATGTDREPESGQEPASTAAAADETEQERSSLFSRLFGGLFG